MSDHLMVIPGFLPVGIGDGPKVATYPDDMRAPFMQVWVDGRQVTMGVPWPKPRPIPGTPYEAYVLDVWTIGQFAIRLRKSSAVAATTTPADPDSPR